MMRNFEGAEYTGEQVQWLKAIEKFIAYHRRQPSPREILKIAKSIGYRLVLETKPIGESNEPRIADERNGHEQTTGKDG